MFQQEKIPKKSGFEQLMSLLEFGIVLYSFKLVGEMIGKKINK